MCSSLCNFGFPWISISPTTDCLRGSQNPISHLANKQIGGLRTSSFFSFIQQCYLPILIIAILITFSTHINKIHQNSRLRPFLIDFIYHRYVHFSSILYPSFLLCVSKGEKKLMELSMASFLLQLETTIPIAYLHHKKNVFTTVNTVFRIQFLTKAKLIHLSSAGPSLAHLMLLAQLICYFLVSATSIKSVIFVKYIYLDYRYMLNKRGL